MRKECVEIKIVVKYLGVMAIIGPLKKDQGFSVDSGAKKKTWSRK